MPCSCCPGPGPGKRSTAPKQPGWASASRAPRGRTWCNSCSPPGRARKRAGRGRASRRGERHRGDPGGRSAQGQGGQAQYRLGMVVSPRAWARAWAQLRLLSRAACTRPRPTSLPPSAARRAARARSKPSMPRGTSLATFEVRVAKTLQCRDDVVTARTLLLAASVTTRHAGRVAEARAAEHSRSGSRERTRAPPRVRSHCLSGLGHVGVAHNHCDNVSHGARNFFKKSPRRVTRLECAPRGAEVRRKAAAAAERVSAPSSSGG